MKKKTLTLILSVLIGLTMLVMPIYADDSYTFTKVKTYSWICNGVHYHINWKSNHFRVDKYDPETSKVTDSALIDLTVKKNEDSDASVAAVRPSSGLVYLNVMRWYSNWLYIYDQKTETVSLAQVGADIAVKTGADSFIGSSRTPTDISPTDYTLYKFTDAGCSKIKTLAKNGNGACYKSGKIYYGMYPLPDRTIYGDKYPDMHKIRI